MSFLEKVAALEASDFRDTLGLPPRSELASPPAFAAALVALGKRLDPAWLMPQVVLIDCNGCNSLSCAPRGSFS